MLESTTGVQKVSVDMVEGTNFAELEVHPRVRHRRHLDTAASVGKILNLASKEAVDMGANDGVSDEDSILLDAQALPKRQPISNAFDP
ncbi:hypothetical protein SCA6_000752 [Theobroma cacao]